MSVRVRFAPSPTGALHIGSVRTVLYNYFFARQHGGALVLRIEDTDQDRLVPGAVEDIYEGLHWIGVDLDEGPQQGGAFGPYVQSERLHIHQQHAEELVAAGAAYHCFCSKERLAEVRAAQQARGEITRYDRLCRTIEPARAIERAQSEPHVIRLKVPEEGTIGIDDLIHGHIEWPLRAIDDQVLLKSDGFPTYQFAVVVDDHLMKISHVFRAEEFIPSIPKHLLVYNAFGWEVPPHAHLPDVLGPDGKKLSKRHGATSLLEFREQGYLPEALVNYLALVGWAPGTEEEVFSRDELIRTWKIEQVQRAPGKWDVERLRWFNGVYIRALPDDELLERLRPFVPAEWDLAVLRQTLPLIRERMHTLADARGLIGFLFSDDLAYDAALLVPKKRDRHGTITALTSTGVVLRYLDAFTPDAIEQGLRGVAEELGWSAPKQTGGAQAGVGADLGRAVRVAITGSTAGPPLYDSMALLGKERCLARLEGAMDRLEDAAAP